MEFGGRFKKLKKRVKIRKFQTKKKILTLVPQRTESKSNTPRSLFLPRFTHQQSIAQLFDDLDERAQLDKKR
jgi:hypothetical protein